MLGRRLWLAVLTALAGSESSSQCSHRQLTARLGASQNDSLIVGISGILGHLHLAGTHYAYFYFLYKHKTLFPILVSICFSDTPLWWLTSGTSLNRFRYTQETGGTFFSCDSEVEYDPLYPRASVLSCIHMRRHTTHHSPIHLFWRQGFIGLTVKLWLAWNSETYLPVAASHWESQAPPQTGTLILKSRSRID